VREQLSRVDTDDQLGLGVLAKVTHCAKNPLRHGGGNALPAEGKAITQDVSRQERHWTRVQLQLGAHLLSAFLRRLLPLAGKVAPQAGIAARRV